MSGPISRSLTHSMSSQIAHYPSTHTQIDCESNLRASLNRQIITWATSRDLTQCDLSERGSKGRVPLLTHSPPFSSIITPKGQTMQKANSVLVSKIF